MIKKFFWPEIDTLWSAKKACVQASSGALLVALITSAVTLLQIKGAKIVEGMEASFIDAALFFILFIFIYRCSRIAALGGLLLYAAEQIFARHFSAMVLLLTIFFLNGVRGAFAYHEMKKGLSKEEIKQTLKTQKEETEPYVSPAKRAAGLIVLALLIGGGIYWFFSTKTSGGNSKNSHVFIEDSKKPAAETAASPPLPVPGQQSFKLKNGRMITGKIIINDPVYYTVETSSGKQEVIIKEDIAG